MSYSYYYFDEIADCSDLQYDIFISAFDSCERTDIVFNSVRATEKYWIVFPQYDQPITDLPQYYLTSHYLDENDFITDVFSKLVIDCDAKICIDSTGFIIPHFLYLIQFLYRKGIKKFDVLYSEPVKYLDGEETEFSNRANQTRPIEGYSAIPHDIHGDDMLIVFAGFNDNTVTTVARDKSKSRYKYFISGFPSLQADMYQQNLIQLNKSKETIGTKYVSYLKAPAYDPFVAADKLQQIVDSIMKYPDPVNCIHVAPLSTKPMAIAAALVYLFNPNYPIDIIYPPSDKYNCAHAKGKKRTWRYSIEL